MPDAYAPYTSGGDEADYYMDADAIREQDGKTILRARGVDPDANALLAQILAELGQKVETASLATLASEATVGQILAALASVAVTGPVTNAQLRAAPVGTEDTFTRDGYDTLVGDGGVQTLDFGEAFDLIWLRAEGGNAFARVTGDPASNNGVFCEDGIPQPITRLTQFVKVWAPGGVVVHGWAYGYG